MVAKKHSGGRPATGQQPRGKQVEIPQDDWRRLQKIAQWEHRSMRAVVVLAIEQYYARHHTRTAD